MSGTLERVRRAFAEFLTIPTLLIVGFLLLAGAAFYIDQRRVEWNLPLIATTSHESVTTLLGTIAASIITVTSITFSLLLIAVQQSAAALTGQVYDQFLRRRANQVYFGYFIGLALYCLVILATIEPDYTPVYGAMIGFLLMVAALFMLILLIYASIDQMRPVSIIRSIRDHTLAARKAQRTMLAATSSRTDRGGGALHRLRAGESGFVTLIDVERLEQVRQRCAGADEVVLLASLGDYVSIGEDLLELRYAGGSAAAHDQDDQFLAALRIEHKRDLGSDPGYGIEQLVNIAWTTISTSKQNPQPGRLACRALRDCVAHWYGDEAADLVRGGAECRIVLEDKVPQDLVRAFETLAVVASESMQHHVLAEVYRALALALRRLPAELRAQVEGVIFRSLSMLADHALTAELDESLEEVIRALPAGKTRDSVGKARDRLAATWGVLNSRSSRVENPLA